MLPLLASVLTASSIGFTAEPAQIIVEVAVIHLPEGAAVDIGLNDAETVLTAREAKLLQALFKKERASGKWSEPQNATTTVTDGQRTAVNSGDDTKGLSVRVTPTIAGKGGSIRLLVAPQITRSVEGRPYGETVETTVVVPESGTAVIRRKSPWGEESEVLIRVTAKVKK